jgi:RNA 2',3'-cyclic 3'-phosphodiesterase
MKQIEKSPTRRLFFALWPNSAECAALSAWHSPLRELCGGRVMRTDTLHFTLVFLGDVEKYRLDELRLVAQGANVREFELKLTAAHYWGHNHIVYAAPDTIPPQLAELVQALEAGLRKRQFPVENRMFKPHVTLLRNAQWSDAPLPTLPAVSWKFNDFVLVQSSRDEEGVPYYELLARFGMKHAKE